jgi:ergothioneine biosynthesis protein EgtB
MLAAQKGAVMPQELASREIMSRKLPELMEQLSAARRRSDALFALVRPDSLYERPIPERHRIIFYVGHLEAFDWNLLNNRDFGLDLGLKSIHPEFDRLFAFGIDPVGGGLPTDAPSDWPSMDSVRDYVNNIRGALDQKLAEVTLEPSVEPETQDGFSLSTLLNVAFEHRLMHVETLAYMLHQLPFSMKVPQPVSSSLIRRPVEHNAVAIPAGPITLGFPRSTGSFGWDFGWDNEYESHTVEVPAFEIDRYKVSNRQYLEFVTAGGYGTRSLWRDDDWNWKTARAIAHPLFWKRDGDRWLYRTMFSELPFEEGPPLDWPVYVSQAEASAYARWAGKSLPVEAEWQRAAYGTNNQETRLYPWGSEQLSPRFGNFDFHRWDPAPVNAFPDGQSAFGVHDMLGNGWEWTATVFSPFPGFKPFPFYRGYSADFFDGKHFVMKGGSARTAACMLRPTFRNWFQAHYQNVYAGFRCVSR